MVDISVAAIAIELTERLCLLIERSDENRVFVDLRRLADLSEGELRRAVSIVLREPHSALHTPPQHDRASLFAPALEPNRTLLRLKTLTGVPPLALARQLLDHAFDVLGQTQLVDWRLWATERLERTFVLQRVVAALDPERRLTWFRVGRP
jgi:hypothetical protein